MKENVIILGAGIAGLAAAERLRESGINSVIFEKDNTYGGLCNSFQIGGFTFDTFAHISFDKNTESWLENRTPYYKHEPEALNYDRGIWLRHPVQNNLFGLPVEERIEIIKGFISRKKDGNPENYAQWLQQIYGKYFAEKYPYRYTRKYWTVEPDQLEPKWVQGRMYEPSLDEVLRGVMTSDTPGVHYSKEAHYPQNGGFKSFLAPMEKSARILYNKNTYQFDPVKRRVIFQDGCVVEYDYIISTVPLPEICKEIINIPDDVKKASESLYYTSGVMVSLGINRGNISPALWYYIYDEDILPARIYAPDWKSKSNVPDRCSAIQCEIYYSKFRPLRESLDEVMDKTVHQLLKLGLFKEDEIIVKDVRMKKYANIIFTPEIYEARNNVHHYLDQNGIYYAGRFGEWDYLWVGQSLLSGRRAAEKCIQDIKRTRK